MSTQEINQSGEKRYAVVTGANKGIGLEICKQLASNGVTVVLTARDEKRGNEALDKFKGSVLADFLVFHQLDVVDPSSIATLAQFVKTQFGRLDILVNNAGIGGGIVDEDGFKAALSSVAGVAEINWTEIMTEPLERAIQCLETNYYGAKRMIEQFIPLLQLSPSPRIVNVSSSMGKLKGVCNEWAKGILSDGDNLTKEKVDAIVNEFLKDFKEGSLQAKDWPKWMSAYIISKAALNGYTRTVAKKYSNFRVNCVCPGYVKTDINFNTGILSVEDGAETPVKLALLPDDGPSGLFFDRNGVTSFE